MYLSEVQRRALPTSNIDSHPERLGESSQSRSIPGEWERDTFPREPLGHGQEPRKPLVTGYRVLLSLLTAGFGFSKAILSYQGQLIAPTTLELVFGVVISLGQVLVWLGWLPESHPHALPWLFEVDLAPIFSHLIGTAYREANAAIGFWGSAFLHGSWKEKFEILWVLQSMSTSYLAFYFPILFTSIFHPRVAFVQRLWLTLIIFISNMITAVLYPVSGDSALLSKLRSSKTGNKLARQEACYSVSVFDLLQAAWVIWHLATYFICLSSVYGGDLIEWMEITAVILSLSDSSD